MEENSIVVIDESGKEINMEIVFTYEDEESGKNYVFYFDPSQEDGEVFVSCYDPEIISIIMAQNPKTPEDKKNRMLNFTVILNRFIVEK